MRVLPAAARPPRTDADRARRGRSGGGRGRVRGRDSTLLRHQGRRPLGTGGGGGRRSGGDRLTMWRHGWCAQRVSRFCGCATDIHGMRQIRCPIVIVWQLGAVARRQLDHLGAGFAPCVSVHRKRRASGCAFNTSMDSAGMRQCNHLVGYFCDCRDVADPHVRPFQDRLPRRQHLQIPGLLRVPVS